MKSRNHLIAACVTLYAIAGCLFTNAQAGDAFTPAEESVCDPLKNDGVTKGLYGLCIAFCEAQDIADENIPITEAELEALAENAPSASILRAYNRKKQPNDPDMPCIVVQNECPCWSAEELASIDGYIPSLGSYGSAECVIHPYIARLRETGNATNQNHVAITRIFSTSPDDTGMCWYFRGPNNDPADMGKEISRAITRLDYETYAACRAQQVAQAAILCP